MTRFIANRLGQGLFALSLLAIIVFALSRLTGDPVSLMLPIEATPEMRETTERRLGLDQPVPVQFGYYLRDTLTGNFGTSIRHRVPVTSLFAERFPNSIVLVVPAFLLACLAAVPLGVVGATTRHRAIDKSITVFVTLALAAPVFWLALLLVLVFAVGLGWLPTARMGGPSHYVLPVTTLALFLTAGIVRLIRSSMLDNLGSDFIKLARLEGLPERVVIWSHALRNSLTGAISFLGVYFSVLITGSIVIETVFAWPGAGRLLFDAITARDYPVIQGVVLLSGAMIVFVNIAVDVLQAYLDPRIRL